METKLTIENWEDEFNNKLVDWNSPRFIQSNQPVKDVKAFIKRLLLDLANSRGSSSILEKVKRDKKE